MITINEIQELITEKTGVVPEEYLSSQKRSSTTNMLDIMKTRFIFVKLLKQIYGHSNGEVAKIVNRDRTTIIHLINHCKFSEDEHKDMEKTIEEISNFLDERHNKEISTKTITEKIFSSPAVEKLFVYHVKKSFEKNIPRKKKNESISWIKKHLKIK